MGSLPDGDRGAAAAVLSVAKLPIVQGIAPELKAMDQWVGWKYVCKGGKWTKAPVDPFSGREVDVTKPAHWYSFDEAYRLASAQNGIGLGFVLHESDPYCGIDLDDCIDENHVIHPAATDYVNRFRSYTEISPSRTGLKIWVLAKKPEGMPCKVNATLWGGAMEVYEKSRFFTVTGDALGGMPSVIADAQAVVDELATGLFAKSKPVQRSQSAPSGGFSGDDQALFEQMFASKHGADIKRLYDGDISKYNNDDSAADQALCNHLAWWTNRDAARMDRMFRGSKLMRDKWERQGYREGTMGKAIESCPNGYDPSYRSGSKAFPPNPPTTRDQSATLINGDGSAPIGWLKGGFDVVDGHQLEIGQRHPVTGALILSESDTLPTAESFITEFCQTDGTRTLHSYGGMFMSWATNHYFAVEEGWMKNLLQPWLRTAMCMTRTGKRQEATLVPFKSNSHTINSAVESIKTYAYLPGDTLSPSWLRGKFVRIPATEILACQSLNVHLPTRSIFEPTPDLFTQNALAFDFDPDAPLPTRWLQFLDETLGDDQQSKDLLQEFMGYCLTGDTDQQKMLLIVGPRRSGKGTIGRVLKQLVGEKNSCGPTVQGLGGSFGLQPLIGKSLAVFSDARFSGNCMSTVVEVLLCLSGQDSLTINRKFLPSITVELPTKVVVLTNELPRFTDASGALASRFLLLRLKNSFLGCEQIDLTGKLTAELPGILLWAIAGWQRLHARGRFVEPSSTAEEATMLEDMGSPIAAFVRARVERGVGFKVNIDDLFEGWKAWHLEMELDPPKDKPSFGRDLRSVIPDLKVKRGTHESYYSDIRLKGGAFGSPPDCVPL